LTAEALTLAAATKLGSQLGERIALGEQAAGQVAQTRQPLLVDDSSLAAYLPTTPAARHTGNQMIVPMLVDDKLVGVLRLACRAIVPGCGFARAVPSRCRCSGFHRVAQRPSAPGDASGNRGV